MLEHYVDEAREMAAELGRATPMLDRAAELYHTVRERGQQTMDVAVLIEVLESMAPEQPGKKSSFGLFRRS
jgi:3-hydroxyisobutyrate dehydrogenase-like beta-hydroxyacid dehydrogenase